MTEVLQHTGDPFGGQHALRIDGFTAETLGPQSDAEPTEVPPDLGQEVPLGSGSDVGIAGFRSLGHIEKDGAVPHRAGNHMVGGQTAPPLSHVRAGRYPRPRRPM